MSFCLLQLFMKFILRIVYFILSIIYRPVFKVIKWLLRIYRWCISPMLGKNCRFVPTCSEYAEEAIEKHGLFKGGWLAFKRAIKCGPWHPGGHDPVP